MMPRFANRFRQQAAVVVMSMACALWTFALEAPSDPDSAAALRGQYAASSEQLEQSPIRRGLYLESAETSRSSRGDIYAVVDFAFTTISETFTNPVHWCEALILHLNVKYCQVTARDERTVLLVAFGKKTEQPLEDTHRVEFTFEVTAAGPDYTQVILDARKGPLGTRDYHILLECIALDGARSFLHIRYAYAYGRVARLAMRFYLARSGSAKVGFTMIESEKGGPPHLVGGVRAAQERNTMRYFLAIDAYLGALTTSVPDHFEESLERWFAATERYAPQLHEVAHDDYIEMKRREHLRQQQTPP
jgi:hypothetical protein